MSFSGQMLPEADLLAIERLLSDFAWCADRGDAEGLAELFLPEATLSVGGHELAGRAQIAAESRRRSGGGRRTRHVWSNLRADRLSADEISTTVIQLTFEQPGSDGPTQLRANDVLDIFRKSPEGRWRFARRVISPQMSLRL